MFDVIADLYAHFIFALFPHGLIKVIDMKKKHLREALIFQIAIFLLSVQTFSQSFTQSQLDFNGVGSVSNGVTSMMYGPDGRLYVAEYPGLIKILTIDRIGSTNYQVVDIEVLNDIVNIANHDDDGTNCSGGSTVCNSRETIGLTVTGNASNPVFYVTSSDFRIGAGSGGGNGDVDLDTNSGIITRFSWNGSSWDVVDIVRGLPRSEENHATNGLEFATINGIDYLIVASGGHTNAGAPSVNFVYQCEYALSAAILYINLDMIEGMPIQNDNGRDYIYDLPTLDDPTRANVNGITDPNSSGYNGIDVNDPFGGNDGLNQAIIDPTGPVQIYSPGYRNAYDIVLTESGALYVTDNGANGGWGGFPENEGGGSATNNYVPGEPGSQSPSGNEQIDNVDHLQLITTNVQTYAPGSFYGGHPNPVRANPNGAGFFTEIGSNQVFRTQKYDPNGSTSGSTANANVALPANWPPVQTANAVEGDWRGPTVNNPDGPEDNPIVTWGTNTNGIDEYTASNFDGAMQGDLLAGHSGGKVRRVQLESDGTLQSLSSSFFSGIGGNVLGITCNGDLEIFPGTVWVGTLGGKIVVFEPQDFVNCLEPGDSGYDPLADGDLDGYQNQDEDDNGTQICNGGSQPLDFDKSAGAPFISDINDSDDDADGISDANDPFQLGNPNDSGSDAFMLPVFNDLFNGQQGLGGIFGLGMTGLMNNGDSENNWIDWLDDRDAGPNPNDVLGGAPGIMTSHMTDGTALGVINNQDKGYQYGVQVDNSTGVFTVTGGMNGFTGPLRLYENTNGVTDGELGFFIGDGTQSNYIKFVVTTDGFKALQEINDIPQTPIQVPISIGNRPTDGIRFYFVINPTTSVVDLEYQIDNDQRAKLGSIAASGSILQAIQTNSTELAVGFIGSSNTPNKELEGSWDFLNVEKTPLVSDIAIRVNASGNLVSDSVTGVDWQANPNSGSYNGQGFSVNTGQRHTSNLLYTNRHSSIPDEMDQSTFEALFQRERYDLPSGPEMEYSFPLPNDEYVVNIFAGNSFSGTNQVGDRVFDIMIEGQLLGDDIDLVALFGHESGGMLSYQVQVLDGELNVRFIHGIENPLLNAIEIAEVSVVEIPISVNLIANQSNTLSEILNGNLGVIASGGDGNLVYSASGLPPGISINTTNGQINGIIDNSADTDQPYLVTITVDDSDTDPNDMAQISFQWQILEPSITSVVIRVNSSGNLVSDPETGIDWQANPDSGPFDGSGFSVNTGQGHPSDLLYSDRHTSIPAEMDQATFEALFDRERYDLASGPEMEYSFPLPDNQYVVNIFAGNSFTGTSQVGDRVFDIMIEGQLLGDNVDLVALFGHKSGGMLSYQAQVEDGELNIQFIHGVENPLLNAIEIRSSTAVQNPISVQPIADQNNVEGDTLDGNLGVVALGGDGNLTFSATGLPPGVFIEPTNGQIGGSIDTRAAIDSPYGVTVTIDDSDGDTSDAVSIDFDWTITNNTLLWTDRDENENYTGRHECSFVQAGNKFYLMGGRENSQSIEVYDYATDSWTALTNSAPFEFNHFQATEYNGLIWVIGAFDDNNFPNEVPSEYVWIFDPVEEVWYQGPQIPSNRQRGSSGVVVYDDKFYIIGGNTDGHDGGYVSWFDEYDPKTGVWTPLTDAPRARDHFHAVVIGNKVYAAGGRLSGGSGGVFAPTIPEIDVYDFSSNSWTTLPSGQNLPTERAAASAVNFNNKLVVIGGEVGSQSTALKITEEFDPIEQAWNTLGDLNSARHGTQAIVSGSGVFIAAGSPVRGGGNQKNMEYLGMDAPQGMPGTSSTLAAPASVQLNSGNNTLVSLDATGGNTGVFVTAMNISGSDAADFAIVDGYLDPGLINANSSHFLTMVYTGTVNGATANLVVDYGVGGQTIITLIGNQSSTVNGVFSMTLVNAETDADMFELSEDLSIDNTSILNTDLAIRANTNPGTVGSVLLEVSGPVSNSRTENTAPYTLFGDNSGNYSGVPFPVGDYTVTATAYTGANLGGSVIGQPLIIQFSVTAQVGSNSAPIVNNPGTQINSEGDAVSLQILATDDGTSLSYSATNLPPTLNINPSNGLITGTIDEGSSGGVGYGFLEENGLVIIEAESGNTSGWGITNLNGETGIIANTNSFNSQNGSTIPYEITISTPGVYRFNWRSFYSGPDPTEENDNWLRLANDENIWFFGIDRSVGNPGNEAIIISNLLGSQSEIVFPKGSSRITSSTTPNGSGSNGYFKVFRSDGASETYKWQARTSDNDSHDIYAWFVNPGTYTMEISERSSGHAIDRLALYKVDTYGYDYNVNNFTNLPESNQGGGGSLGAAENSPYSVSVTVTDDGAPQLSSTIEFTWNIGQGQGNNVPPTAVAIGNPDAVTPLQVNFSSVGSNDPDGSIIAYDWDFGDGNSSTAPNPSHIYAESGSFSVTLAVTDNEGASNAVSIGVDAIDPTINQPPNAVAGATPITGIGPLQVDFSSIGSDDLDGTVVSYVWDFGDGIGSSFLPNPSYTYNTPGDYTAILTVTDNDGYTDTDDVLITVVDPIANGVISFTLVDADADMDMFDLTEGLQINESNVINKTLNIRANTNPAVVGSVFMEISGTLTDSRTENVAVYALYGNNGNDYAGVLFPSGEYTMTATAYSGSNQNGTVLGSLTVQFEITSSTATQLPIVDAGPDQNLILPTNSLTINGSGSDPDGGVISYQWTQENGPSSATLEGDMSANLSVSNLTTGIYIFRLTITDDETDSDFDDMSITVSNPPTVSSKVNSGGPSFTFNSETWNADQNFSTSNSFTNSIAIANTTNDQLYQSERYARSSIGSLSYDIPLPDGQYDVVLHFAEIWFGASGGGPGGVGSRIFNIDIENGTQQLNDYDIIASAGGSGRAVQESFTNVAVSDGALSILFTSVVENAKVSGIEIFTSTGMSANSSSISANTFKNNSLVGLNATVYPNPASIYSYVQLNESNTEIEEIILFDVTGRLVRKFSASPLKIDGNIYQIPIGNVPDGLYHVHFITTNTDRYYKMLIVKK